MHKKIFAINLLLIDHFGIPKRAKELPDPLDMLIATILSQNTNDQNSYKAYENLKKKYITWDDVRKARRSTIENIIKIAGLGYQKSSAIKNLLTELYKKNGSLKLKNAITDNNDSAINFLTSFKGIGVKTASCVLLFSLDRDVCPVDTHLHRTLNRIGLVNTKTPDKTFFALNEEFPQNIAHSFHTNLIRLGREICKPKTPHCAICPVEKICSYNEKDFSTKPKSVSKAFMLLDHV